MKRGTPEHPKTLTLASILGVPRYQAVGILECLWQWTARYAPRGDIGRWDWQLVADYIGWRSKPARLLDALISANWLDRNEQHGLLVHHWSDHADDTCDKYLRDHGLTYADGNDPRRKSRDASATQSRLGRDKSRLGRDNSRLSEPEPEPEPVDDRLQRLVATIRGAHEQCADIPERTVVELMQGFRHADWEEAMAAFARDWSGSSFNGSTTPVKELRKYLAKSERERTGAPAAGAAAPTEPGPRSRRFRGHSD